MARRSTAPKGKKVFTLPDGVVEQGTYSIDATKSPPQIDATTEGKDGTQSGIYMVKGDELTMCLASQGVRPGKFATAKGSVQLLIVLMRAAGKPKSGAGRKLQIAKPSGTRSFRMGFAGFIPDTTLEAVNASRKFVRENGDILAHHIEGVPWAEALSGEPFPKSLLSEWEGKKSATPPKAKSIWPSRRAEASSKFKTNPGRFPTN